MPVVVYETSILFSIRRIEKQFHIGARLIRFLFDFRIDVKADSALPACAAL
ncbi:hypothetical protein AM571_PC00680 (plasmid) [Rhizobium etli 8C-3]|uniref:Uncharacterized protein n=1 Tax=Rhizobium etli 8C-3 TaxID=538025 RepID=A0A1L5PDY2_RHIET|nr:hypothetical protein AM571_PC00680 [Rhizobium etli 8C-3]